MKKKILLSFAIMAVFLFAFAVVSSAATYYVDYEGNLVDEASDNIAYSFEPGGDRTIDGNKCFRVANIFLHDTSLTKIVFPVASEVKSGYTGIAPQNGWSSSLGVYAKDDTEKVTPLNTQIKEVVFLSGADFDGASGKGAFSGFTGLEKLTFYGNVSVGGDAAKKGGFFSNTSIKQIDFYGNGKINGVFMKHINSKNEVTITFHEGCTAELSTRYNKDGSYHYNFPSSTLNNWKMIVNPGVTYSNFSLKTGDTVELVLYDKDITGLTLIVAVSNTSDYEGTDLTTSHGLKYSVNSTSVITATVNTWCELGYHSYEAKQCVDCCSKCGDIKPLENPKHNMITSIVYDDFATNGAKITKCLNENCPLNTEPTVEETEPLFVFKGYSTDGKEICVGYTINVKAIDEYKAANPTNNFRYGVVASVNNTTPLTVTDNTINVDLTSEKYTAVDFKLTGNWSIEANTTAKISMNMYTSVANGETTKVSYVYGYNNGDEIVSQSYDVADQITYIELNP